jgi:hypothetical protein
MNDGRVVRHNHAMKRRSLLTMIPLLLVGASRVARAQQAATVYKDPTCGCCGKWVDLLRKEGFTVTINDARDITAIKDKYGVPQPLRSCHTALVNGYIVEGHVPLADVTRLLQEKTPVAGLAVPGMPIGSPGMEVAGVSPQPYDVLAFGRDGKSRVFASHRGA